MSFLRRHVLLAVLFIIAVGFASYHFTTSVANADGKCTGGGSEVGSSGFYSRCGFFTNSPQDTSSRIGPNAYILSGGVYYDASNVNHYNTGNVSKSGFETAITNYLSGSARDALGAKFVIELMLGYKTGTTLTAAMITDWENRINSPAIAMTIEGTSNCTSSGLASLDLAQYRSLESAKYNSKHQLTGGADGAGGDDAFVLLAQGLTTADCNNIVFRQGSGGAVLFEMREICGNVFGNLPDTLPQASYSLAPTIGISRTSGGAGDPVTVTPKVDNSGAGSSSGTIWQISTFTLPAGTTTIPKAGESGASDAKAPCDYYVPPGGAGCTVEGSGASSDTGVGNFAPGTPSAISSSSGGTWGPKSLTLGDYPSGTLICYALSVRSESTASTNWANSAAECVVLGKKPQVQVLGGDLTVGRVFSGVGETSNVDTSQTIKSGTTYGSWVEYAILASGSINGTGSGAAFGPLGLNNDVLCNYSTLSFTNTGTATTCANNQAGTLGGYNTTKAIPNVTSNFTVPTGNDLGVSPTIDLTAGRVVGGVTVPYQGVYSASGSVTITGGSSPIPAGRWFVLEDPSGTVTITGNIEYTADTPATEIPADYLHSISDIPQVIISAANITINDVQGAPGDIVTQVDSWLVASDSINTCNVTGATTALTITTCPDPLVVNGPVMASKLYLNRTGGAENGALSGTPAETFNLRPDAYLWGYEQATAGNDIETAYSSELPPRF